MFLLFLGACGFASSLSGRVVDPLVTSIARDFAEPVTTVAMLASAYTLPYAISQPFLGPVGDSIGKERVLTLCVWAMAAFLALGVLAPSLLPLSLSRVVAGAAAGGVIPLGLAIMGDRYPIATRQVAMTRFLGAALVGQLLGATFSGVIAEAVGWRWALAAAAAIGVAAALAASLKLRAPAAASPTPFRLADAMARYRLLFSNPNTIVCYSVVFTEGICIYGVLPFVAEMLEARQAGGPKEAGFILAGIGLGGVVYVAMVKLLLSRFGTFQMMRLGGILSAFCLAALTIALPWPAMLGLFTLLGFGFFMLHNSMQSAATELAPTARGSAMSLHAFFFFLGQAAGPPLFGLGMQSIGVPATLLASAAGVALAGHLASSILGGRARAAS